MVTINDNCIGLKASKAIISHSFILSFSPSFVWKMASLTLYRSVRSSPRHTVSEETLILSPDKQL